MGDFKRLLYSEAREGKGHFCSYMKALFIFEQLQNKIPGTVEKIIAPLRVHKFPVEIYTRSVKIQLRSSDIAF